MDFSAFWNMLMGYLVSYGGRILVAALILIVGFRVAGALAKRVHKGKLAGKLDHTVSSFLQSFLSVAFKTVLVISAIGVLGVPMSSVITVLATVGAAIGLALQGSLSNFAGGIMLMVFKPFHVDDYVETQEVSGTVSEINIFYTILKTPDNKSITLPNGTLMNSTITNYSANDIRRVDLTFSVSYDSDIDRVSEVLNSIVSAHPLVLQEPAFKVALYKQGDSALQFILRPWCKREDYWTVYFDLTEAVKKAFDKTGIEIPFPQMDIHIKDGK